MAINETRNDPCAGPSEKSKITRANIASSRSGAVAVQIRKAIADIENKTSCEGIETAISTLSTAIADQLDGIQDEITTIASKFLPLLKLPTSIKGVLGAFKKLITSTIAPQLQAYIQLTNNLIEIAELSRELTRTIGNVIPRLEQCAIDTVNQQLYGLQSELNTRVNIVVRNLSNNINKQLCDLGPSLTELGATLNDAVINTQQVVDSARSVADQADASIAATLSTINNIGSSLQQIAPITFNIDTSTAQAFQQSIAAGAFDQFTTSVNDFIDLERPTNIEPPTIIGTPSAVGQILTANTGTWTGNNIVYSYQWYRNDIPIANANTASYQLTAADGNSSKIKVEISASNQGGDDAIEVVTTTTYVTGGLFVYGQRIQ